MLLETVRDEGFDRIFNIHTNGYCNEEYIPNSHYLIKLNCLRYTLETRKLLKKQSNKVSELEIKMGFKLDSIVGQHLYLNHQSVQMAQPNMKKQDSELYESCYNS